MKVNVNSMFWGVVDWYTAVVEGDTLRLHGGQQRIHSESPAYQEAPGDAIEIRIPEDVLIEIPEGVKYVNCDGRTAVVQEAGVIELYDETGFLKEVEIEDA